MAEVEIPPVQTEPEIPEEQLPELEKPTETSKVISVNFSPLNTKQTTSLDTRESFFTTDTDAWIVLNVGDMNEPTGKYSLVLYNREDGSIFQRAGNIVAGSAYYKLQEEELKHAGRWTGQVVITLNNGKTTTSRFSFLVSGHLLDGKDIRQIVIEDFQTLMRELEEMKNDVGIDFSNLKNDIEEAQRLAVENEQSRQAAFETSENNRQENEDTRVSSEKTREVSEESRAIAETARKANENGRVTAENERKAAETTRQTGYAGFDGRINEKANRKQEDWIIPTLLNSWTNFGGNFGGIGYKKNTIGKIEIKGTVKGGVLTNPVFVLPVGYRPLTDRYYPVIANSVLGMVTVKSTGEVRVDTGSNVWVSLNNINFYTDE